MYNHKKKISRGKKLTKTKFGVGGGGGIPGLPWSVLVKVS